MYCSNCGNPLPDDAKFCPNCGAPVAMPKKEDLKPAEEQKSTEEQKSVAEQKEAEEQKPVEGQNPAENRRTSTGDSITDDFVQQYEKEQHSSQRPEFDASNGTRNSFGIDTADKGNNFAIVSLVCGCLSIICWFLGTCSWMSLPIGVAGLVCAAKAKKYGNDSSVRVAGFITSLVGVLFGVVIFVACVGCISILAVIGASS